MVQGGGGDSKVGVACYWCACAAGVRLPELRRDAARRHTLPRRRGSGAGAEAGGAATAGGEWQRGGRQRGDEASATVDAAPADMAWAQPTGRVAATAAAAAAAAAAATTTAAA